jgi:hypothetical protein
MHKTPMRQPHRLSVLLMFVVVMSYPVVVQAMPESFIVEYTVRFGKYDKRAYTYVEGLRHGTIDWPDGSSDRYSTPVVLIYPDKKDGNGFGWVDIPTTSYFLLYTDTDGNTTGGIRSPSRPSMTQAGEPAGAPTGVYGGTDATFFPER